MQYRFSFLFFISGRAGSRKTRRLQQRKVWKPAAIIAVLFLTFSTISGEGPGNLFQIAYRYYQTNSSSESTDYSPGWTVARSAIVAAILISTNTSIPATLYCNNPLCYEFQLLHWTREDLSGINGAVKLLTNTDLISKFVSLPEEKFMVQYNPEGIQNLFQVFENSMQTFLPEKQIQQLYDHTFKNPFRARIAITRLVFSKKELFFRRAREYNRRAMEDHQFNGREFTSEFAKEIGCSVFSTTTLSFTKGVNCDERWIGMLIRRYNDQSLNGVLSIINRILNSYDSEESKKGELTL